MQRLPVILRPPRVSRNRLSHLLVLFGLLVAMSAQAQTEPYISITGDVPVGRLSQGIPYTASFTVHMFGVGTVVSLSVQPPAGRATSVTSISPQSAYINALQAQTFEVRGVAPSTTGPFSETIVFTYRNSSGNVSFPRMISGESVLPPPTTESYWVGVIPSTASCPAGTSLITVFMDDEDTRNANNRAGWIGAFTSDRNTTLRFCRVDGRLFKPLAETNEVTNHYAVLKLGTRCPSGSTELERAFDNENGDNQNWADSSSGNDSDLGPIVSSRNDSMTYLYFCLFKAGSSTMSSFPSLGIQYGVFAASDFSRAIQTGWVFTDDEDRNPVNNNRFLGDSAGRRIIEPTNSDGRNTTLHIARVTPETRPVARCTSDPMFGTDYVYATFEDNGSYARGERVLASYSWSFSDGWSASGPGPHYRGFGAGSHYGALTVTDNFGESHTAYCNVHVYSSGSCLSAAARNGRPQRIPQCPIK